jgi:hypothetical protein
MAMSVAMNGGLGHEQGPWTGFWRIPNLAPVSGGFRLARYTPEWPGPRPLGCMPRAHVESVDRYRV